MVGWKPILKECCQSTANETAAAIIIAIKFVLYIEQVCPLEVFSTQAWKVYHLPRRRRWLTGTGYQAI